MGSPLGLALLLALLQQVLPEGRTGGPVALAPAPPEALLVPAGEGIEGSTAADVGAAIRLCLDFSSGAGCPRQLFLKETPALRVRTRAFLIGATEVRNEDYEACVRSGACLPRTGHRPDRRLDGPSLPVVDVTHGEAEGYCRFRGGRLPTEAEWERAARGPGGRRFPWGDLWNGRLANHGQSGPPQTDDSDGFRYAAPVGSYPAARSPYGALDMAGNVWEWVADWYGDEAYREALRAAAGGVVADPTGPEAGRGRVIRGGSWAYPPFALRSTTRGLAEETERAIDIGFRCAWDLPPWR